MYSCMCVCICVYVFIYREREIDIDIVIAEGPAALLLEIPEPSTQRPGALSWLRIPSITSN